VYAAKVVNATGPWLDRVRRLEDEKAEPSIRLSKGVHLIADGGENWNAAVTIPHDKVRVSFAIPWEGKLLLGTTDTLHEGEPEDARVTDEDVRTILDEAAVAVREIGEVRASFYGLRVLPGGPGATANARRETVLHARRARNAERRRRQADDLSPNRPGRARTGRRAQSRPQTASAPGRHGFEHDRVARRARSGHAYAPAAPLWLTCTRGAPRPPSTIRRSSSRSSPAALTCAPRSAMRADHEWARTDEDVYRRRTTVWLAGDEVRT